MAPGAASAGIITFTDSAVALAIASAASCWSFCTNMRLGALQLWPVLVIIAITPLETAFVRSAVGRTMFGLLPPSSCATRLTVGAAACATSTPARVEPVKLTMSTSGCEESTEPTPGPSPLTRLNTPFGTPASCRISAKIIASSGAISDGFSTIVQPAAIAGATLQAIWFSGQFQGVMNAQTPIGSLRSIVVPFSSSHLYERRIAAVVAKWPMPAGTWAALASHIGAPISSEMATASSGIRFWIPAVILSSRSARYSTEVCEKLAKARLAAATALSASAFEPSEMTAKFSSVAGFSTSRRRGTTGSTQAPSI